MKNRVIFREYRRDDSTAVITELLHAAYGSLARIGFRYMASHQDEARTLQRLQRGFSTLAELDGRIIGTITLRAANPDSRCEWYQRSEVYSFGQFAVHPDFQKCGIGLQLYQLVEQQARSRAARELACDTAEGALHLCSWYERLGFRFVQYITWEEVNYRSVVLSKKLDAIPETTSLPSDCIPS